MEIIIGIFSESFWYMAPILVTATTFLSGLINQGFKITKGWLKQLIAWVLGAGLSVAAWGLKLVTFGSPIWLGVIVLCAVVGLAANGFYDIKAIKNWIDNWFTPKALLKESQENERNDEATTQDEDDNLEGFRVIDAPNLGEIELPMVEEPIVVSSKSDEPKKVKSTTKKQATKKAKKTTKTETKKD